MGDVHIRVVELLDHVLSAYDRKIGEFTAQQFKRSGAAREVWGFELLLVTPDAGIIITAAICLQCVCCLGVMMHVFAAKM